MKQPYFPKINLDKNSIHTLFEIKETLNKNTELQSLIHQSTDQYYAWDKFSNLKLPTTQFTHEQLWAYLKLLCRPRTKETRLIVDKQLTPFWYSQTDRISQSLHIIDKSFSGNPLLHGYDIETHYKEEWARKRIITSFVEEAIQSSLIEGAAITRRKAKEFIISGKKPRNKDETMVLNNYKAITLIKSSLVNCPVDITMIQNLHSVLTENTIEPKDVGRFREDLDENDKVFVYDDDGTILHTPVAAEHLQKHMQNLCDFINTPEPFIHPVIKAIIIHFSIGYIHPFYDGNGRVARGLFYWYLLRQGYKLFEFISISEHINKNIGKYKRAYLNTETDDNDLTYFIYFHLDIIEKCLESLKKYIHQKLDKLKTLKTALRNIPDINIRQLDLLNHALKHVGDDQHYTIESHQNSNGVAYATARDDLFKLADRGFLEKRKFGKKIVFHIPPDLTSKIPLQ